MKSEKILRIAAVMLWAAQLLVEGLTFAVVVQLNLLPEHYLAIVAGMLLVLWLIVGGLLLIHGKRSGRSACRVRRVTAVVLSALIIFGCTFAAAAAAKARDTVNNVSGKDEITTIVQVLVAKDDPARNLQDAASYEFAVLDGREETKIRQAIAEIEKELGMEISVRDFQDALSLFNALDEGSVNAVIMTSAMIGNLKNNHIDGLMDLSERIRVLHEVRLTEQISRPEKTEPDHGGNDPTDPDATENGSQNNPKNDITERPFVFYISASDTRSQELVAINSDVNILVVVNPVTKQVLLLNTPRDYYVPNSCGGGAMDKLTHCGSYGIDCSIQALTDLYGVDVDYYAQINFAGFVTLIDAVGGVTVYSDVAFTARDTYIEVGDNYLDGEAALDYTRERYHLATGDNARGENQMKVIKSLIEKLSSGTTVITHYSEILESLEGMFITSMTSRDISGLVKMQLSDGASWNVQSYAVNGAGGYDETYSIPGFQVYVTYQDEGMVNYGAELVRRVLDGDTLTKEDVIYPGE